MSIEKSLYKLQTYLQKVPAPYLDQALNNIIGSLVVSCKDKIGADAAVDTAIKVAKEALAAEDRMEDKGDARSSTRTV